MLPKQVREGKRIHLPFVEMKAKQMKTGDGRSLPREATKASKNIQNLATKF